MILLFSGGVDSTVLAIEYIDDIKFLLHFRYNHPAKDQEIIACKKIHKMLLRKNKNLRLHVVDLPIVADQMFAGSGAKGSRYVPNRNAIFLSVAANFALQNDCDTLIYGASLADQQDYYDCRPEFFERLQDLLQIKITAPLIQMSKKHYREMVDLSIVGESWSCYEPINGKPCGSCNSCTQR